MSECLSSCAAICLYSSASSPLPRAITMLPNCMLTAASKSSFALYLMIKAAQAERNVILAGHNYNGESVHLLRSDGTASHFTSLDAGEVFALRQQQDTVLIFDGDAGRVLPNREHYSQPPPAPATTVYIAGIHEDFARPVRKFGDLGSIELTFPVLSKAEIEAMLHSCFPHLAATPESTAAVWRRYDKWGGVPRFVFDARLDQHDAIDGRFERALPASRQGLRRFATALAAPEIQHGTGDVAYQLAHWKPQGETATGFERPHERLSYLAGRADFASDAAAALALRQMQAVAAGRLRKMVMSKFPQEEDDAVAALL